MSFAGFPTTFDGTLYFADAHALELGLAAFDDATTDASVLARSDLKRDGLAIRVAYDQHAPDVDHRNLEALARFALRGEIETGVAIMTDGSPTYSTIAAAGFGLAALAELLASTGDVATLRTIARRDPAFAALLATPPVMAAAIRSGELVAIDLLLEHGATLPDGFAWPKP